MHAGERKRVPVPSINEPFYGFNHTEDSAYEMARADIGVTEGEEGKGNPSPGIGVTEGDKGNPSPGIGVTEGEEGKPSPARSHAPGNIQPSCSISTP